jgi:hypothetical protein
MMVLAAAGRLVEGDSEAGLPAHVRAIELRKALRSLWWWFVGLYPLVWSVFLSGWIAFTPSPAAIGVVLALSLIAGFCFLGCLVAQIKQSDVLFKPSAIVKWSGRLEMVCAFVPMFALAFMCLMFVLAPVLTLAVGDTAYETGWLVTKTESSSVRECNKASLLMEGRSSQSDICVYGSYWQRLMALNEGAQVTVKTLTSRWGSLVTGVEPALGRKD